MITRCHMQAIEQGSRMTIMFPTNSRHWHPMLEDVAYSDAFELKLSEITSCLERNDEWRYISMDATMKICLKVMGGEASEQVVAGLLDNFTDAQLKQVRHVGYDNPSEKLYGEMLAICPNMQSLMLDPVRLVIVYEYGFWNKRSAGSKQLRRILHKCSCRSHNMAAGQLGSYYDGSISRPLQVEENKYRTMILDYSMDDQEVNAALSGLQPNLPFAAPVEFIKCIAAWCAKYQHEVSRKAAGPNKEIYNIL